MTQKEIPILFSGPMALATLRGIKTQTMRMDGLHEINKEPDEWRLYRMSEIGEYLMTRDDNGSTPVVAIEPRYQVGDILWGREAWRADKDYDDYAPRDIPEGSVIRYEADGDFNYDGNFCFNAGKLRPSLHMVRWMSRIKRRIVGVELGRVQGITEEMAIVEGVYTSHPKPFDKVNFCLDEREIVYLGEHGAIEAFAELWNSINAKRGLGWDKNPWAWTIKYEGV